MTNINQSVGGYFEIWVNDKKVAGNQNLITDGCMAKLLTNSGFGRNNGGSNGSIMNSFGHCFIGSGTTPPTNSDTSLTTTLGSNYYRLCNNLNNVGTRTLFTQDGEQYCEMSYGFSYSGFTNGTNVSEVGVMLNNSNTEPTQALDSKILIRDASGNPLTLTMSDTDTLNILYRFRYQVCTRVASKIITVDGSDYKISYINRRVDTKYPAGFLCFDSGGTNTTDDFIDQNCNETYLGGYGYHYGSCNKPTPYTNLLGGTANVSWGQMASNTSTSGNNGVDTWYLERTFQTHAIPLEWQAYEAIGRTLISFGAPILYEVFMIYAEPKLPAGSYSFTVRWNFHRMTSIEGLPLNAFLTPSSSILETGANGAYTTKTSASVVAGGGQAPYTYSWAYVSGGSALLSADSPTSNLTTFTGTGTSQQSAELWRVTITDALGATATADITVDVTWA